MGKWPELKSCPFCGNAYPDLDELKPGIHVVCCSSEQCGAIGPGLNRQRQTSLQAIERWNVRHERRRPVGWDD